MRKIINILFGFLLGIIICAIFIIIFLNINAKKFLKDYIDSQISKLSIKVEYKGLALPFLLNKFEILDVFVEDINLLKKSCSVNIPKIVVETSALDILRNNFFIKQIVLERPSIKIKIDEAKKNAYIDNVSFDFLPVEKILLRNGELIFIKDDIQYNMLNNIELKIFSDSRYEKNYLNFNLESEVFAQRKGFAKAEFSFLKGTKDLNFEGNLEIKGISLPYFYSIFGSSGDIVINGGTLSLKSALHCSNNWLTMSNIVNIYKLDILIKEKKIFGIPSDDITSFFRDNDVAFDLPVNGNIYSLKFDITTSATQILMKALDERFKDKKFIRNISEKIGQKIGKKLESGLSKFFYNY